MQILDDVSFSVDDGEMLVVTGPNGGGKSTIAKILMGIEKASGGKISLDGEDITDYTIDQRAEAGIGFASSSLQDLKADGFQASLSRGRGETEGRAVL